MGYAFRPQVLATLVDAPFTTSHIGPTTDQGLVNSPSFGGNGPPPHGNPFAFETFVAGNANRRVFDDAMRLADHAERGQTSGSDAVYLYGSNGLGKTHLLHVIGQQSQRLHPTAQVLYVVGSTLVSDFVRSARVNAYTRCLQRYAAVDLLLLDDFQQLCWKEKTQGFLANVLTMRLNSKLPSVLTGNRPLRALEGLNPQVVSHLLRAKAWKLVLPELDARVSILVAKASSEGIELTRDTATEIATRVESSIPWLADALRQMTVRREPSQAHTPPESARAKIEGMFPDAIE